MPEFLIVNKQRGDPLSAEAFVESALPPRSEKTPTSPQPTEVAYLEPQDEILL
jgi:hypothetical protein